MVKKDRKVPITFYLDNTTIKRIDAISQDPNTASLDDRSKVIRYCVKQHLPFLEKQLKDEQGKTQ